MMPTWFNDPGIRCTTDAPEPTLEDFNNMVMDNVPQLVVESKEKYYCEYCFGHTFDDSRGHCCACGHPREIKAEPPAPQATLYGKPITDEEEEAFILDKSRWGSILNAWVNI